ncbi:MAG: hypothetical protein LBQ33_04475, partial [Oscillospiraceae bacterium]|jgi:heat-inducible transcriptional repressor|nr:hypothetical protein [Oscillospiraceae bacterium]
MAQLAELGFLEQPHTSAGRIPSPQGYRYYINHHLPGREPGPRLRKELETRLAQRAREPETLLKNAGMLLAELTACAAVCVPPGGAGARVRRLETAPVGGHMAMVALLTSQGLVKSKVIRTQGAITPVLLETFVRLTEEHLCGRPLEELTLARLQSLAAQGAGAMLLELAPLLAAAAELAQEATEQELLVGEANLFQHPLLESDAQALLEYLQGSAMARLLHESAAAGECGVILGAEASPQHPALRHISLIVSPYAVGDAHSGLLGVFGPLRQDYASVVPSVRFITSLVAKLLAQTLEE